MTTESNINLNFAEITNNAMQNTKYHTYDLEGLKKLSVDPQLEKRFLIDIDRTVKRDKHIVKLCFHTGLSTNLKDEQGKTDSINAAIKSESSSGKTYTVLNTISYFPKYKILRLGSQSPKVISHEQGILMTGDGTFEPEKDEPLDPRDEPKEPNHSDFEKKEKAKYDVALDAYKLLKIDWDIKLKNSFHLINLEGKIIIFLDEANPETLKMLKTTMSHDSKRIIHKYVDDRGKNHTTVLEGAPALILCNVDNTHEEEFSTRTITTSPETTKEKIEDANKLTNSRLANPWDFEETTAETKLFKAYLLNLDDLLKKGEYQFVIPFTNLWEIFPSDVVRDMRDFTHFGQLLKTYPMLYIYQRPIIEVRNKKYVLATVQDVIDASLLFEELSETTRTGTDKKVLDFYHKYIKGQTLAHDLEYFVIAFNKDQPNNRSKRSEQQIRNWLKRLNKLSYVEIVKDEYDKRKDVFCPLRTANAKKTMDKNFDETPIEMKNTPELRAICEKNAEEYLKTIVKDSHPTRMYKLQIVGEPIELTIEEVKKIITGNTQDIQLNYKANQELKPTIDDGNSIKTENIPIAPIFNDKSGKKVFYRFLPTSRHEQCFMDYNCPFKASFEIQNPEDASTQYFCEPHFKQASHFIQEDGFELEQGDNPAE